MTRPTLSLPETSAMVLMYLNLVDISSRNVSSPQFAFERHAPHYFQYTLTAGTTDMPMKQSRQDDDAYLFFTLALKQYIG